MYIFVRNKDYSIRVKCLPTQSVYSIKNEVCQIIGGDVKCDNIMLTLHSKVLEDNLPLSEYKLCDDDVLTLGFRMRGGDVLGTQGGNFSMGWYILIILIIFAVFFMSGILPIIGHVYGTAIASVVKKIGTKMLMAFGKVEEAIDQEENEELGMHSDEVSYQTGLYSSGVPMPVEGLSGDGGQSGGALFKRVAKGIGKAGEKVGKAIGKGVSGAVGAVGEGAHKLQGATHELSQLVSSTGDSADFINNYMASRVGGLLASNELVCKLNEMNISAHTDDTDIGDDATRLRDDPILSRYYNRVYSNALIYLKDKHEDNEENSSEKANKRQEYAVNFFRSLKGKIEEEGLALDKCLVGHSTFKKVLKFVSWIFKVFGIGIFIYVLTYLMVSPLAFAYTKVASNKYPTVGCTAVHLTKWITLTLVLVYLGMYLLTVGPTLMVQSLQASTEEMPTNLADMTKVIGLPIANAVAQGVEKIEYGFFNLITFKFFGAFQTAVSAGISWLYLTLAEAETVSCDSAEDMNQLSSRIGDMIKGQVQSVSLDNKKLIPAFKLLMDALSSEKIEALKQKSMFKYLFAKFVRFIFCQGLKMADWLYKAFKDMGSEEEVVDFVSSGNIAGVSYTIAFIVILICVVFMKSMFGIKFK